MIETGTCMIHLNKVLLPEGLELEKLREALEKIAADLLVDVTV